MSKGDTYADGSPRHKDPTREELRKAMTTTPLSPAELREMLEKATALPLKAHVGWETDNGVPDPDNPDWCEITGGAFAYGNHMSLIGHIGFANATLIVSAVNSLPALLDELDRLRELLSAPAAPREREPDHCYDDANWEYSIDWKSRDTLTDDLPLGDMMKVGTLFDGPYKFAAHIIVTRDEDGDADETEVRWFDTEAEALVALAPSTSGGK